MPGKIAGSAALPPAVQVLAHRLPQQGFAALPTFWNPPCPTPLKPGAAVPLP